MTLFMNCPSLHLSCVADRENVKQVCYFKVASKADEYGLKARQLNEKLLLFLINAMVQLSWPFKGLVPKRL